ncbi:MAG: winged helix-turn-helix domain-containing protein [Victivallaceae bacterium]
MENEKLIAYLQAMIAGGQYAAGDRLPPLRKLAEQFELSNCAAHRAIKQLCEQGLLELRQGAGTFVRGGEITTGNRKTLSVMIWDQTLTQSYCAYALHGMQEEAIANGWQLKIYFAQYDKVNPVLAAATDFWNCDAAAFLGCYDFADLESLTFPCPCVGLEMHRMVGGVFSIVAIDPYAAAEQAIRHFRRNRVKHVQIVYQEVPVHKVRAEVFRESWQPYGSSNLILRENYYCAPVPGLDPDGAAFFTSGSAYNYAARELRQATGRILAKNPNILTVDGKSLLFPSYEPSNTLMIDWRRAGTGVFDECVRRATNPGSAARRISIYPRLIMHRF